MSNKHIVQLGNGVKLTMAGIPGGSFMMGSPYTEVGRSSDEGPQHKVTLEPFSMSIYPVTQEQYLTIMDKDPSLFKGGNRPVENVSWQDAKSFCQKLSEENGVKFSLPSESQWEYACRARTTTPFNFGKNITYEFANYRGDHTYGNGPRGDYRKETTSVGEFPPNGFGLYDMHGSVWEWCADEWHDNYENAPTDGSAWVDSNDEIPVDKFIVLRGGSWGIHPRYCRSAFRGNRVWSADLHYGIIGFRVVCDGGRTR